jgi:hypothetical protein
MKSIRMGLAATVGLLLSCGEGSRGDAAATEGSTSSATAGDTTVGASESSPTTSSTAGEGTTTSTSGQDTGESSSVGDGITGERDCAGHDPNGVQQIYCTSLERADPWTLGYDDWEVRIRQFGTVSGAGKLTVVEREGQTRMTVKAEDSDCEGLEDHGQALAQGYMCSPNDWRNFEMTGYFQLVESASSSSDQDWTMYGNGGRHTGSGPPTGCLGSSHKGSYHYRNAAVRIAKESWHVNYHYRDGWQDVPDGIDYGAASDAWLGMKFIRHEFERDGAAGVRNEVWLDLAGIDAEGNPANDWQLVTVSEDHPDQPSWGSAATQCGAPADDQPMLWGGPWVVWRWDGTTARLRLMSVREIEPPER